MRRLLGRLIERPLESVALVAIIVIVSVFPLYYAVVTSFKSGAALFEVNYLPAVLDWSNYRAVFLEQPFGRNIVNSVLVATGVVLAGLGLSVTASFALARIPFRGRRLLLMTLLASGGSAKEAAVMLGRTVGLGALLIVAAMLLEGRLGARQDAKAPALEEGASSGVRSDADH